jgi:hypothetical protein
MRRERRQPTRRESAQITSRRPVVRRIPPVRSSSAVDETHAVYKHLFVKAQQTPHPPFGVVLTSKSKASEGRSIIEVTISSAEAAEAQLEQFSPPRRAVHRCEAILTHAASRPCCTRFAHLPRLRNMR